MARLNAASEDIQLKQFHVEGERKIGFELETNPTTESAEKIFLARIVKFKEDRSLRGHSPVEFVTPVLSTSTFEGYIDRFFGLLQVREIYSRQSTHVHIDTSDLKWTDINAIMAKAKANERLFTALCPPSRAPTERERGDGGPRMLPVTPFFGHRDEFIRFLYGRNNLRANKHANISVMRASKRCNDGDARNGYPGGHIFRYNWLNIHGHFHKGAIEFRIFSATSNKEKLKNWIKFLIQYTEAAKKIGPKEFLETPISHFISADVWMWAIHRINSLRELHIRSGTIEAESYLDSKEKPLREDSIPDSKYIAIAKKEGEQISREDFIQNLRIAEVLPVGAARREFARRMAEEDRLVAAPPEMQEAPEVLEAHEPVVRVEEAGNVFLHRIQVENNLPPWIRRQRENA